MSTSIPPKGWTIDTYAAHNEALRHAEKRFQKERDRRYRARFKAAEQAVRVYHDNMKSWQASAIEWREAMNDREGKFATKGEIAPALEGIRTSIADLKERLDRRSGTFTGIDSSLHYVVGFITVVALVAAAYFGAKS